MTLTIITPRTEVGITVAETRDWLGIAHQEHDALLADLLRAAADAAEDATWRAVGTQTLELTLDRFPAAGFDLPRPPLQSVTSIKYDDAAGVEQTVPAADYEVDTAGIPGRVRPVDGTVWPVAGLTLNAVRVRFVAGHDTTAGAVALPRRMRLAILAIVNDWYEHRDRLGALPDAAGRALQPFAVPWLRAA